MEIPAVRAPISITRKKKIGDRPAVNENQRNVYAFENYIKAVVAQNCQLRLKLKILPVVSSEISVVVAELHEKWYKEQLACREGCQRNEWHQSMRVISIPQRRLARNMPHKSQQASASV